MLLSFRFKNYRSFRDEAALLLTPAYRSPDSALKVAGIFGANASGKSNLITSLMFMSNFVGTSDRESEPGLGVRNLPFRLNTASETEPSYYTVDLLLDGIRHTYGFSVSSERVHSEWLYVGSGREQSSVFEREEDRYVWGDDFRSTFIEALASATSSTALLISVAARFGRLQGQDPAESLADPLFKPFHDVYSWLYQQVRTSRSPRYSRSLRLGISSFPESDHRFPKIVDLLRFADLGLLNMAYHEPDDVPDNMPAAQARRNLQFYHRGADGDVVFEAVDESEGTLRLLELGTRAITTLDSGGLLLVDEIDASLHPILTARIIELFREPRVNSRFAQLIFSSHDATLLGSIDGRDILQRDEIWFVEKDDDGASKLYSLVEFKPRREEENRQRRYLSGKYGAIPDAPMVLFENALATRGDEPNA
jgi:hypothetical protein